MPEIGLSGLMLDYPRSGSAIYTCNLVAQLPAAAPDLRFRLFVRQSGAGLRGLDTQVLSSPLRHLNSGTGVGARVDKLAWEVVALPLASLMRRQVLVHSLYFAAPVAAAAPVVVTVHDLIPLVLPGYHRTRQSALYSRLMALTVKRAAAVITVSEHSRKDIVRVLGIPEGRVHVTYEAADERFRPAVSADQGERVRRKYGLPPRFLLYIGGAERRKNLETLVSAYARVASQLRDREVALVIVARFPVADRLYPDVPALAGRLGLGRDVVFVPEVDEDDKPELYRSALGFCYPSRYEGFGLPPLEAMASGVPAIVSSAASLPEVTGDGGWLLDPDDVRGWSEAMLRLVDSEHERLALGQRGIRRAATFSWERTARETVAVYRQLLQL